MIALSKTIVHAQPLPSVKAFGQPKAEPLMGAPRGKAYEIVQAFLLSGSGKAKAVFAIEDAFGKRLHGGTSYFEKGDIASVFHEKDYCGVGIVKQVLGIPYLDKFAVMQACKGNGLGTAMLDEIIGKYPTIMLRASTDNGGANSFYQKSGAFQWMEGMGEWNIYVRIAQGAKQAISPEHLGKAMEIVSGLPKTIY